MGLLCARLSCRLEAAASLQFDADAAQVIIIDLTDPTGGIPLCIEHVRTRTAPLGWTLVDQRMAAPSRRHLESVPQPSRTMPMSAPSRPLVRRAMVSGPGPTERELDFKTASVSTGDRVAKAESVSTTERRPMIDAGRHPASGDVGGKGSSRSAAPDVTVDAPSTDESTTPGSPTADSTDIITAPVAERPASETPSPKDLPASVESEPASVEFPIAGVDAASANLTDEPAEPVDVSLVEAIELPVIEPVSLDVQELESTTVDPDVIGPDDRPTLRRPAGRGFPWEWAKQSGEPEPAPISEQPRLIDLDDPDLDEVEIDDETTADIGTSGAKRTPSTPLLSRAFRNNPVQPDDAS